MWKSILVPHDFSPCSDRALDYAVDVARVHRAGLTLLHVCALPDDLSDDTVVEPPEEGRALGIAEYATRGALRRLETIAEPRRREQQLTVATKAVTGACADEILRVAQEIEADLIVVGTHGRTGLSHLLRGSVVEEIVRRASIPVLTIRFHSSDAQPTSEERAAEDELAG
ncbi:MAG: universal stress protein [Polyangiaceae bacterium]